MAEDSGSNKTPADRRERARLVGGGVALALIVGLGFDNRHEVRIGYLFGHSNVRLVYLLFVFAVLGALVGWLAHGRRHH